MLSDLSRRCGGHRGLEEIGAFDEIDHLSCGAKCQWMVRSAWPRRDVARHFMPRDQLPVGRPHEQRDHQVFQRDHAHAKLHEFGVGDRRNIVCSVVRD